VVTSTVQMAKNETVSLVT